MTPSVQQLLMGVTATIASPLPPEAGPDYTASRNGMLGSLAMLCAQEADRAVPVRTAENAAIHALLSSAAARYPDAAPGSLPDDVSVSGLDRANAALRRKLIALHVAVEDAGDTALHLGILRLYQQMARGRRLALGGG
jgi:hypothetical protein